MRRRAEGSPPYGGTRDKVKSQVHKVNCRVAAREGGLGRAPTFYEPALPVLFYARFRAETGWEGVMAGGEGI